MTQLELKLNEGQESNKKIDPKEFMVHITTPYLSGFGSECGQASGTTYNIESANKIIWTTGMLDEMKGCPTFHVPVSIEVVGTDITLHNFLKKGTRPDFIISGATRGALEDISELMGSGIIVARYSKFFGGEDEYWNMLPEQTGYSLDIRKNGKVVAELLSDQKALAAFKERNEELIRDALKYHRDVLVTPYLSECLKVRTK